jgi:hypothetical protein
MRTRIRHAGLIVAVLALTLTGCTSATATRSPEIAIASPDSSVAASPEPSLEPSASAAVPPASVATLTQPPAAIVATWTKAGLVGPSPECGPAAIGIDSAGRYHVAASCGTPGASFESQDTHVRYFTSLGDDKWSTTDLPAPADRWEFDPKLAFHGSTAYLAYSRVERDSGCGGGYPDVGVYYRVRSLPDGAWSAPIQLGPVGDGLHAFREDSGTILATVHSFDGHIYFETLRGSDFHRYLIADALQDPDAPQAAMRVAGDGTARIAYAAAGGIRFGRFADSGFTTSTIAGTKPGDFAPVLVLDTSDHAHVLWTRYPHGGCALPDPPSDAGLYYATNVSGTWKAERFTTASGSAALQVDNTSGQVDILTASGHALGYYTKPRSGPWANTMLSSPGTSMDFGNAALARDPARGTLLAVWSGSSEPSPGIYFATKG